VSHRLICPSSDPDQIHEFLCHLTKGWPEGSVFELRVLSESGSAYSQSFLPSLDGLQAGGEWAAQENKHKGNNLYVIPNPKKVEQINKTATDKDILGLTVVFVDQDDAEAPSLVDTIAPSWVVTTGTIPHLRKHGYWRLSTIVKDVAAWKATVKAIQKRFQGDPIANPSRIMRLPGTVSYPTDAKRQRGYVEELVTWSGSEGRNYPLEELAKTFGVDGFEVSCASEDVSTSAGQTNRQRKKTQTYTFDKEIIDLLNRRRNTLAKRTHAIWRNIAFGTIDKYRGTQLEEEARVAFFGFSQRWEYGQTKVDDIKKLWRSDDKNKSTRVKAGTTIMELKKLPPIGPTPDTSSETRAVTVPKHIAQEIVFTGLAARLHDQLKKASDRKPGNTHIGGVIATLSAVFGSSAVIQNGVQGKCCTNLYVLILAQTAFGKETIRSLVSASLRKTGRGNEVFDGAPSDVSFHALLARTGGRSALLIDEAGILAKAIKSTSLSWQRLLMSLLMQIYGRGLTQLEARRYRDSKKDIDPVENPRPTLMLTSTVGDFVEGTTQEDSASGFFNRLVTFVDEEMPPLKAREDRPDRQAVVDLPDDIGAVIKRTEGIQMGPGLPQRLPSILINCTEQALDRLLDFKFDDVETSMQAGGLKAETWGRAVENAQRIAGLLAVSDAVIDPNSDLADVVCDVRHVEQAIAIITQGLSQLEDIASQAGKSQSAISKQKDDVIRYLEKVGGSAPRASITRHALRGIDSDARRRLLDAMIEDGEIEQIEEVIDGKTGPKTDVFRLVRNSAHD
jgi:hypothetical protein